ncbi:cardiolipin synthase [Myroides marinus]|uniref:cardiolipin synthase n=1 Tax=Myroides TaxID=76831 RepID=UPI0025765C47|nr:cardiolipin synthase [Myroides marinus]MDM1362567.1 cardiolipin synthase [Myroides marinus]MDM1369678.1 cardiolipin synthase [Myroides marinus]MDM1372989.1 cardiolipin synthase [Myroides marinus]MDM1376653.1 cardiolipin synthase [Myroides marinus]MDM1380320.1 cardiolipin synthase [Myroides marinus]
MFLRVQSDWFIYLEIVYFIIAIAVAVRIIYDTDSISKTLSYLLLVFFVPIFGMIFYFSFGINYRKRKMYSKKLKVNDEYSNKLTKRLSDIHLNQKQQGNAVIERNSSFIKMLSSATMGDGPLLTNNKAEILENGEEFFPRLLEDLRAAKNTIHIEYYIYENNEIGKQIEEVLIQKAKEGVKVRFIYDDFGCKSIRKNIVRNLRANGIEAFAFNEIILLAFANRMNYRNHRKIVVIDGRIAYTGGINISDRYDNRKKDSNEYFWRDTHMRIEGSGAYGLQYIFLADWNFCSKQDLAFNEEYFPILDNEEIGEVPLQVISSGPDSDVPSILYSVLKAIQTADKEICITTPYYIPDESLQLAIKMASLSGKKVKMILPGITDSNIVKWASESYFQELLEFGVEIYLYKKGFIHAKTFVTDSGISSIGTCNLDHRSFDLNFEVNVVVYDESFAKKMKSMFDRDCKDSIKLELHRWNKRSWKQRLKNSFIRLFSPLL